MLTILDTTRAFERSAPEIAVLPIGAVEQHGSHLPVGTDCLIAGHWAERLARELDAYLLPIIPITSSIEHRQAKGTVYLKAATLGNIVRDVAESLQYDGFRQLIIVNGHGGNWILKPTIRQLNRDLDGLMIILIDTHVGVRSAHEVMEHTENDVHAGEYETSIMMHIHPELVGEAVEPTDRRFYPQDYLDYFDSTELTEDGYWGYPECATDDKGRRMVDMMVDNALDVIRKLTLMRHNKTQK